MQARTQMRMKTHVMEIYDSKYTIVINDDIDSEIDYILKHPTDEETDTLIFYNVQANVSSFARNLYNNGIKSLNNYITATKRFHSKTLKIGKLKLPIFTSLQDANDFKQFIDATILLMEQRG